MLHILKITQLLVALCTPDQGPDLKDLRWTYRIVCIESSNHLSVMNQLSELCQSESEIEVRKVKIFSKVKSKYFENCNAQSSFALRGFPSYPDKDEFKVTLIGLDGDIKKMWNKPIKAKDLYMIIDAMPMRKSEILKELKINN